MGCCAALHITIDPCEDDIPLHGIAVAVTRAGVDPEPPVVAVASGATDETGTVTLLVGAEGTYTVTAQVGGGEESVVVEAECGVNNVTVAFDHTDKICVRVLNPPGEVEVTVADDADAVVGTCVTPGAGPGVETSCCVTIPGPGTYTVSFMYGEVAFPSLEQTVVIDEDDCGDRIVQVTFPTAGPTCDKTMEITLCGCPLTGASVSVSIPGGNVVTGTANHLGVATFTLQESECDDWIGAPFTITHAGIEGGSFAGTVSGDPHTVALTDAEDGWFCKDDCLFDPPDTLTASFSSTGTWDLNGVSVTLNRVPGTWQYASGCHVVGGTIIKSVTLTAELVATGPECNPTSVAWSFGGIAYTASTGCTGTQLSDFAFTTSVADPYSAGCPVNVLATNTINPARTAILSE